MSQRIEEGGQLARYIGRVLGIASESACGARSWRSPPLRSRFRSSPLTRRWRDPLEPSLPLTRQHLSRAFGGALT